VGYAVSNDINREALRIADRFVAGLAIAHYAGKLEGFRDPAPIFFPIELDRQVHPFIIPSRESGRTPESDYSRSRAKGFTFVPAGVRMEKNDRHSDPGWQRASLCRPCRIFSLTVASFFKNCGKHFH